MSSKNFVRNSSISNKNSASYRKWTHTAVHVKFKLILSDFNESSVYGAV